MHPHPPHYKISVVEVRDTRVVVSWVKVPQSPHRLLGFCFSPTVRDIRIYGDRRQLDTQPKEARFAFKKSSGNSVGTTLGQMLSEGGEEEEGGERVGETGGRKYFAQYYTERSAILKTVRYKGDKGKCWTEVKRICKERDGDRCYTCPREGDEWKFDAGHYKPVAIVGSNNKLSWDVRFIHRQCSRCNGPGQGMAKEYEAHLRKDYGDAVVDWFEANYRKVNPIKNWKVLLEELSTQGS